MPLVDLGFLQMQLSGQATPIGNVYQNSANCSMQITGRSFALTQVHAGEIIAVDGHIQRIKRLEDSCATIPQD